MVRPVLAPTSVADTVGSIEHLRLLATLTEADALATSATAWDPWTAQSIARLVGSMEEFTAAANRPKPSRHALGEGASPLGAPSRRSHYGAGPRFWPGFSQLLAGGQ